MGRMIVVAGATGNVGGALVQALRARDVPVRALVRREHEFPTGVEPVLADLDSPASVAPALRGADGVFLLSGYADMPGLLAEVAHAGVGRVALLSSSSVPGGDLTNAVAEYHIRSEQAVRDSGVPGTFLRPSMFMTNALQWAAAIGAGVPVRLAWPEIRAAVIDPADIAEVAAVALLDGIDGPLRLTGPAASTPAERLAVLGELLGRDPGSVPLTAEESVEGFPERYATAFRKFYVDGDLDESRVTTTVQDVLGRAPRTFRDWAAENFPR
jgi:uncharacterized protein YbjT (DUF2867 family)